jgi:hypothetical protein
MTQKLILKIESIKSNPKNSFKKPTKVQNPIIKKLKIASPKKLHHTTPCQKIKVTQIPSCITHVLARFPCRLPSDSPFSLSLSISLVRVRRREKKNFNAH